MFFKQQYSLNNSLLTIKVFWIPQNFDEITKNQGYVQTRCRARWRCSSTILAGSYVNTPFFAKYFLQNSVTLPVPGYKVSTLQSGTKLYLDTVWTQHYFLPVPRHQYLGKCEQTPLRQPC